MLNWNTQGIWILYGALWTWNFLNVKELRTIAAGGHWSMEETVELNQPLYIGDILASKHVALGESLCFCYHRIRFRG